VRVCPGKPLSLVERQVHIDQSNVFGCIGCGQCVAVCPKGAIHVNGRDFCDNDILPMPTREQCASYDSLKSLLLRRRSIREFSAREVDEESIEQIIEAASSAPMGFPPSDVRLIVIQGRARVRSFRDELMPELRKWKWLTYPWASLVLWPFFKPSVLRMMRDFMGPVIDEFERKEAEGGDAFLYDAPLAIYFHASSLADPADPTIAATYAMLAAEALGLGTCMLGVPGQVIKRSKKLKRRYGVEPDAEAGLALIIGYPAVRYRRSLKRHFGEVRYSGQEGSAV